MFLASGVLALDRNCGKRSNHDANNFAMGEYTQGKTSIFSLKIG
jgi:hypothetical protein